MPFTQFCLQNQIAFKKDEIMKAHTSFKIGGKADFFVSPKNADELKAVICECKRLKMPYFVIGKGSNLLVSDKGIEGAVISLSEFDKIEVDNKTVTVGAGASLARLCTFARDNSLSGLEFAYGIPGSVGGALYMNAGAYGGEMSQVVVSATVLTKDGEVQEIDAKDMALGYRTSIFKTSKAVILSAKFGLETKDITEITAQMDELLNRRVDKQPFEYPSAGSSFKRPTGYFAGALIEQNNLKGSSVGGAQVSEKHAGFVINYDNATANDVLALMQKVKDIVLEKDGVELEPEVIFVGRK
jgi:UDP-N-acetylmuramate dehydrogenase